MYGTTFNLLYRAWITDMLDIRETSAEETPIIYHLLALRPHCNIDLFPRACAACLALDQDFLDIIRDRDNRAPDFEFEYWT